MTINQASVHADLHSLDALKSGVSSTNKDSLESVAAQFESIFVQMMVKSMREATIRSDLLQSNGQDTFQQMFDQQISVDLSKNGGLGLAQILVEQLSGAGKSVSAEKPASAEAGQFSLQREQQAALPLGDAARLRVTTPAMTAPAVAAPAVPLKAAATKAALAESPEAFIRKLWEPAVKAAKALNVAPEVLVAQSALETGWGQKVIRAEDGRSSFNLFGIKADRRWQGPAATVSTLEYEAGVAKREQAAFRVYDSVSDNFNDYVNFLQSNPRYQQALSQSTDNRAYLQGLQDAGYATDPKYADKIMAIMGGERYGAVVNELKVSQQSSLGS